LPPVFDAEQAACQPVRVGSGSFDETMVFFVYWAGNIPAIKTRYEPIKHLDISLTVPDQAVTIDGPLR
jgi:hypothetical protein